MKRERVEVWDTRRVQVYVSWSRLALPLSPLESPAARHELTEKKRPPTVLAQRPTREAKTPSRNGACR